jgi:hypothetical protein
MSHIHWVTRPKTHNPETLDRSQSTIVSCREGDVVLGNAK